MKSCPVCHLLNNDNDTKCGNCGTPLCSNESHLSDNEGKEIRWDVLKRLGIPVLGLLDSGLLIAALVRGTFMWEMLLILLLQASGIAQLLFPDAMYKFNYWFLTKPGEQGTPGDYYYFRSRFRGFILLIIGIIILIAFTFSNI